MPVLYHWKHGWIPLDHIAALSKAKGNHEAAAKMLKDAHGPDAGMRSREHVAKAVRDLPNVPAGPHRDEANRKLREAADHHGAHDLLPGGSKDREEQYHARKRGTIDTSTAGRQAANDEVRKADQRAQQRAAERGDLANAGGSKAPSTYDTKSYDRGYKASMSGSSGALDRADSRREPREWHDGYMDHAVGRPRGFSKTHTPEQREAYDRGELDVTSSKAADDAIRSAARPGGKATPAQLAYLEHFRAGPNYVWPDPSVHGNTVAKAKQAGLVEPVPGSTTHYRLSDSGRAALDVTPSKPSAAAPAAPKRAPNAGGGSHPVKADGSPDYGAMSAEQAASIRAKEAGRGVGAKVMTDDGPATVKAVSSRGITIEPDDPTMPTRHIVAGTPGHDRIRPMTLGEKTTAHTAGTDARAAERQRQNAANLATATSKIDDDNARKIADKMTVEQIQAKLAGNPGGLKTSYERALELKTADSKSVDDSIRGATRRPSRSSTELAAAAQAQREKAQRIADGAGTGDRAAGRLSPKGLKQAHRGTDSALRRYTEASQAAKALDHKAGLQAAREREAVREHFTHDELKGATLVQTDTGWHKVVRVNAKSVTVETPYSWTDSIPHAKVHKVAHPGSEPGKSRVSSPAALRAASAPDSKSADDAIRGATRRGTGADANGITVGPASDQVSAPGQWTARTMPDGSVQVLSKNGVELGKVRQIKAGKRKGQWEARAEGRVGADYGDSPEQAIDGLYDSYQGKAGEAAKDRAAVPDSNPYQRDPAATSRPRKASEGETERAQARADATTSLTMSNISDASLAANIEKYRASAPGSSTLKILLAEQRRRRGR